MKLRSLLRTLLTLGEGVVAGLPEASTDRDPIELFSEWFQAARDSGILLPESTALATATPEGKPSARMVLLKSFDAGGFVFYTNYGSRKAGNLDSNPHAVLLFHWAVLQRQVCIEGAVVRTTREESEAYFHTRPRGSQIGAWASRQSEPLESRAALNERVDQMEKRFAAGEVPLPSFWGGYRLVPERIEFWQGRVNRLHDRLSFVREGNTWKALWLYP
jgi:pyridoxamine 5'-phosphate oxidase